MSIFMDRHEMHDMTAENVADAHRKDLQIQGKYGDKYMTYWFNEKRGTGFCLVEAPDAATAERVHREAHGEMPATIIPVDLATVEAFLGRICTCVWGGSGFARICARATSAVVASAFLDGTRLLPRYPASPPSYCGIYTVSESY